MSLFDPPGEGRVDEPPRGGFITVEDIEPGDAGANDD